jgi:hypothetical protein
MEIVLVDTRITKAQLKEMGELQFGSYAKAVVDVNKAIMAVGGDFHADEEAFLLDLGSNQKDLWGINLHFDLQLPGMVEFDSIINIRPSQGNPSRGVVEAALRERIVQVVAGLVE